MLIRRLLTRLTLFLLPFGIIIGGMISLTIYSGEAMPYEQVAALQYINPKLIYFPEFNTGTSQTFTYKLASLKQHPKSQVLILGSSRVLAFQAQLIDSPSHFYNFGIQGSYLDGSLSVLNALTAETMPDVIILGVDVFWFNANPNNETRKDRPLTVQPLEFSKILEISQFFAQSLLKGDINWMMPLNRRNLTGDNTALGLSAQSSGRGFRVDGSFQSNTNLVEANRDRNIAEVYQTRSTTLGGDSMADAGFVTLEQFLIRADDLGIEVIGFLPPYLPELYTFIQTGGQHGYFEPSRAQIKRIFERHGVSLFDFSDIQQFGVGAEEMNDFVHPSGRLSARMFAIMAREIPSLHAYADPDRIERAIADSPDPIHIFGD